MACVHPNAPGLDVGSREIRAAVPPDRDGESMLHMEKALQQMNVQLHHVLSDLTGASGQLILCAIVAGERDPVALARLRHPACKSCEGTIAKALSSTWRDEHLFVLRQALELLDAYTAQIAACEGPYSLLEVHVDWKQR